MGENSVQASPLANAALEDRLRQEGHPYLQIAWRGGEFEAIFHPGTKAVATESGSEDILQILARIVERTGVETHVHESGGGLPLIVMVRTDDPAAALDFIVRCQVFQIAILPLSASAFVGATC